MPRFIALYKPPADPEAFEAHYRDVHTPIIERYPNLRRMRLSYPQGVAGQPAPFYLMAEMIFDTDADLRSALQSQAGAESAKDLRNFAQAGVTTFIAPDEADA